MANYTLSLEATSGAAANGSDTNTLTVTLLEGSVWISGADIDLSVISSSTALFSGGLSHTTVMTNTIGTATAELTDSTEETVTIRATLISDTSVTAQADSTFGGGDPDSHYAAPSVTEAINGELSSSLRQATVVIQQYDGMATGDTVVLMWRGIKADGSTLPAYRDTVTVTTPGAVTFSVPSTQISPLAGGSVSVSYSVNDIPSSALLLVVSASSGNNWLAAPSVREASGSQLSSTVSQATVDIAPWAGMAAGDLVELGWRGNVTQSYNSGLTVSAAFVGETVSISVPASQIKTNTQVALNYTVRPADGSDMRVSYPLALRVL